MNIFKTNKTDLTPLINANAENKFFKKATAQKKSMPPHIAHICLSLHPQANPSGSQKSAIANALCYDESPVLFCFFANKLLADRK